MGNWGLKGSGFAEQNHFAFVGDRKGIWHSVGIELPKTATWGDLTTACPIIGGTVTKEQAYHGGLIVPDTFITVRCWQENGTDMVANLGAVGKDYSAYQDEDMYRTIEAIMQDPNGPLADTAGCLFNGRKTFVSCKMPGYLSLKDRKGREVDGINVYIMGSNEHTTKAKVFYGTAYVRTVCMNTEAAFRRAALTSIMLRHSGNLKAKTQDVIEALGLVYEEAERTHEAYQALISVEPDKTVVEKYLDTLYADPTPETRTADKPGRYELQKVRVRELAECGMGNNQDGIRGTGWAWYNATTQLEDWQNNKDVAADKRFNVAVLGSGMARKENALEVAMATFCNN